MAHSHHHPHQPARVPGLPAGAGHAPPGNAWQAGSLPHAALTPFLALPLAAGDAEDVFKFIFTAIFILIWVAGGILSSAKKKRKPGENRTWEDILRDLGGQQQEQRPVEPPATPPPLPSERPMPGRIPPAPYRPMPEESRQRPARIPGQAREETERDRRARQNQQKRKLKEPRRPREQAPREVEPPPVPSPASAFPAAAPPIAVTHADISASEITSLPDSGQEAAQRARSGASAFSVARWLTPATLRQQYILTEILQPPVAMRRPSDPMEPIS